MDGRRLCPAGFHGVVDEDAGTCSPQWIPPATLRDCPLEPKEEETPNAAAVDPERHEPNETSSTENPPGSGGIGESSEHGHDGHTGSIMMMSTVFVAEASEPCHELGRGETTDDNLKQLAQRLRKLKDELNGSVSNSSPCHRSSPNGLAMQWSSCEQPRAVQSIRSLDGMPQVWTSSDLRSQGEGPRRIQNFGYGTGVGGDGTGGTSDGLPGQRDERKDLPRESYGDQGQAVGDESWAGQHQDPGQSGRSSGCITSERHGGNRDYIKKEHHADQEHYGAYVPEEPYDTNTSASHADEGDTKHLANSKLGTIYGKCSCCAKAKAKMAPRTPVAEREISEPLTPEWRPEIMEIHCDGSAEVVGDSRASGLP